MAEGLNPIEIGRKLHEHGEAANQRSEEEGGQGGSSDRHSRIVQICEAVLLALVTVTAAWAGYSAAKWSTASRVDIARASTLGNLATRDDLTANSLRDFDASTFNAWFIAFTLTARRRKRSQCAASGPRSWSPSTRGWQRTRCTIRMPRPARPICLSTSCLSRRRPTRSTASLPRSSRRVIGSPIGDNYVRITVFLAAVLFLVDIGSSFKLPGVRYALIAFGSVLLIISIVLILQQPGLPS